MGRGGGAKLGQVNLREGGMRVVWDIFSLPVCILCFHRIKLEFVIISISFRKLSKVGQVNLREGGKDSSPLRLMHMQSHVAGSGGMLVFGLKLSDIEILSKPAM